MVSMQILYLPFPEILCFRTRFFSSYNIVFYVLEAESRMPFIKVLNRTTNFVLIALKNKMKNKGGASAVYKPRSSTAGSQCTVTAAERAAVGSFWLVSPLQADKVVAMAAPMPLETRIHRDPFGVWGPLAMSLSSSFTCSLDSPKKTYQVTSSKHILSFCSRLVFWGQCTFAARK